MADYSSNTQRKLKVGINSFSENLTVLHVVGNAGIGTTNAQNTKLYVQGDTRITGILTAATLSAISGNITNITGTAGTITNLNTTNATGTNLNFTGVSTLSNATGTNLNFAGVGTITTLLSTSLQPTNINSSGISTLTTLLSTSLQSTNINVSGVSTLSNATGTNLNFTGVSTLTNATGTNLNFSGISTLTTLLSTSLQSTNINISGVSTLSNATGTNLNFTGVSTFSNGPVLIGSATSTGTLLQRLQVTGGAYISGSVGIATTNPIYPFQIGSGTTVVFVDSLGDVGIGTTNATSKLHVIGDATISGVVTALGGFNIGIQSAGTSITTGVVTAINFVGTGNSLNYNAATKTVNITIAGSSGGSSGGGSFAPVNYIIGGY